MKKLFAPLLLGFGLAASQAFAADKNDNPITIERTGWALSDGGCHIRIEANGRKIRVTDLYDLHEHGETRDGRLTLSRLFPDQTQEEAKNAVMNAVRVYKDTARAIKRDPACDM